MIWRIRRTFHHENKDIQRRLSGHVDKDLQLSDKPIFFHSENQAVTFLLKHKMAFKKVGKWRIYTHIAGNSTISFTINRTRSRYRRKLC